MSNLESGQRNLCYIYDLLADCFLLNVGLGVSIYLFTTFQLKVYIRTRPIIKACS